MGEGNQLHGDGWQQHFYWWSLCRAYRCQIIMLYTWNLYDVVYQFYLILKRRGSNITSLPASPNTDPLTHIPFFYLTFRDINWLQTILILPTVLTEVGPQWPVFTWHNIFPASLFKTWSIWLFCQEMSYSKSLDILLPLVFVKLSCVRPLIHSRPFSTKISWEN